MGVMLVNGFGIWEFLIFDCHRLEVLMAGVGGLPVSVNRQVEADRVSIHISMVDH